MYEFKLSFREIYEMTLEQYLFLLAGLARKAEMERRAAKRAKARRMPRFKRR